MVGTCGPLGPDCYRLKLFRAQIIFGPKLISWSIFLFSPKYILRTQIFVFTQNSKGYNVGPKYFDLLVPIHCFRAQNICSSPKIVRTQIFFGAIIFIFTQMHFWTQIFVFMQLESKFKYSNCNNSATINRIVMKTW